MTGPSLVDRGAVPESPVPYPYIAPFPTDPDDIDRHGHLNSTVYYIAMDAVIGQWLDRESGMDLHEGPILAYCAASSCQFLQSASLGDNIGIGVRISRIGRTSITWLTGVLRLDDGVELATGRFVHVFVDRETRRPRPLVPSLRAAAGRLVD